jgi:hypothetical protein
MGQHPRTWFSSTTAGFPRADAAWLLRQISSLETPGVFDPAAAASHGKASRFRFFGAIIRNLRPKRSAIRQGKLLPAVMLSVSVTQPHTAAQSVIENIRRHRARKNLIGLVDRTLGY